MGRLKMPWIMKQTWSSLLFAHYRVDSEHLQSLLPSCLEVDLFDASAWVSVVPFEMNNVQIRGTGGIFAQSFLELNVRTYVKFGKKPGVYFFSLDANHPRAVTFANVTYGLPYLHADMSIEKSHTILFNSIRTDKRERVGRFEADYTPVGEPFKSKRGFLPYWLTERYSLFVVKGKSIFEGKVDHPPWRLQQAEVTFYHHTVAESIGVRLPESPEHVHYSDTLDVRIFPLNRVGTYHH
ncbi:hypothetical protein Q75_17110 [Bacillus coahuilensis p1.1.43]|uniref:DUF2071 domain-containing protein n=1 Tax=Bacillus coahuilensis p1.1.43 TaxID=1150625 RepID=A0A147K415_9BACI|nr:DUF2071 domain-containing protein [Bacillus coahuilensis]KUP04032.1 hypothetical protein Q75_17110 [Bacillus coahuilensis p1.1.43]